MIFSQTQTDINVAGYSEVTSGRRVLLHLVIPLISSCVLGLCHNTGFIIRCARLGISTSDDSLCPLRIGEERADRVLHGQELDVLEDACCWA